MSDSPAKPGGLWLTNSPKRTTTEHDGDDVSMSSTIDGSLFGTGYLENDSTAEFSLDYSEDGRSHDDGERTFLFSGHRTLLSDADESIVSDDSSFFTDSYFRREAPEPRSYRNTNTATIDPEEDEEQEQEVLLSGMRESLPREHVTKKERQWHSSNEQRGRLLAEARRQLPPINPSKKQPSPKHQKPKKPKSLLRRAVNSFRWRKDRSQVLGLPAVTTIPTTSQGSSDDASHSSSSEESSSHESFDIPYVALTDDLHDKERELEKQRDQELSDIADVDDDSVEIWDSSGPDSPSLSGEAEADYPTQLAADGVDDDSKADYSSSEGDVLIMTTPSKESETIPQDVQFELPSPPAVNRKAVFSGEFPTMSALVSPDSSKSDLEESMHEHCTIQETPTPKTMDDDSFVPEGLAARTSVEEMISKLNLGEAGWDAIHCLREMSAATTETFDPCLCTSPAALPMFKVKGIPIPNYDSYVLQAVTNFRREKLKVSDDIYSSVQYQVERCTSVPI